MNDRSTRLLVRGSARPGGRQRWFGGTAALLAISITAGCLESAAEIHSKQHSSGSGNVHQPGGGPPIVIEDVLIPVEGGTVTGLLGYTRGRKPTRLVVFCHGINHVVQEDGWLRHILGTVRDDTAVVAANYSADPAYTALGGALDTIQATHYAISRFPDIDTVYLLGVSMGGGVAGIAIAEAEPRADGSNLYDYWIDIEGVSNLYETWAEASAVGHPAASAIETETGGKPYDCAQEPAACLAINAEYRHRSPALRAPDLKIKGLKAAVVVHASLNDGVVPFNQGREMATALAAAGIPVHFFQVLRDRDGETTPPDNSGSGLISEKLGVEDPNRSLGLYLTGHGTETEPCHPVIRTGFEQLHKMLDGPYVVEPYREFIVDDQATPPDCEP